MYKFVRIISLQVCIVARKAFVFAKLTLYSLLNLLQCFGLRVIAACYLPVFVLIRTHLRFVVIYQNNKLLRDNKHFTNSKHVLINPSTSKIPIANQSTKVDIWLSLCFR